MWVPAQRRQRAGARAAATPARRGSVRSRALTSVYGFHSPPAPSEVVAASNSSAISVTIAPGSASATRTALASPTTPAPSTQTCGEAAPPAPAAGVLQCCGPCSGALLPLRVSPRRESRCSARATRGWPGIVPSGASALQVGPARVPECQGRVQAMVASPGGAGEHTQKRITAATASPALRFAQRPPLPPTLHLSSVVEWAATRCSPPSDQHRAWPPPLRTRSLCLRPCQPPWGTPWPSRCTMRPLGAVCRWWSGMWCPTRRSA